MGQLPLSTRVGIRACGLTLPALIFTGCTTGEQIAVEVDSASHQIVPITGKRLWVDVDERAANLFIENQIASKIMHTIAAKGYAQAATLTEADYRLEFSYTFQKTRPSSTTTPAVLVRMGMTAAPRYTGRLTLRVFSSMSNPLTPLWVEEASGIQQSNNMQSMIDYLIAAAVHHLGENMPRSVTYILNGTEPASIQRSHRPMSRVSPSFLAIAGTR